jgi:hypothetical protein
MAHQGCFDNLTEARSPFRIEAEAAPVAFNCVKSMPFDGAAEDIVGAQLTLSRAHEGFHIRARHDDVSSSDDQIAERNSAGPYGTGAGSTKHPPPAGELTGKRRCLR